MNKNKKNTWLMLFVILLCSCSKRDSIATSPLEFDENYLNQQIKLSIPVLGNSLNTTDGVYIFMNFDTDIEITFANNYNLRIFYFENNVWNEIDEQYTIRMPEGDFVYNPKSSPEMQGVYFIPELPDIEKKYLLRVYVSGEMELNNEMIDVAAFTDVQLTP